MGGSEILLKTQMRKSPSSRLTFDEKTAIVLDAFEKLILLRTGKIESFQIRRDEKTSLLGQNLFDPILHKMSCQRTKHVEFVFSSKALSYTPGLSPLFQQNQAYVSVELASGPR